MTIAQYMQAVLTHPKSGYYMQGDVFGAQGDFITSPEISQMFGECLAIWIGHEWQKMGKFAMTSYSHPITEKDRNEILYSRL